MGQTPDEIYENIAAVRARMTDTISAISLAREIRGRVQHRTRPGVRRNVISVDEALDRSPSHQPTGDREVDPEIASTGDPSDGSDTVSARDATRRGRALLAIAASIAAGILAGLASMNDPVRTRRESEQEESRSLHEDA
jgi:hypothetical protein